MRYRGECQALRLLHAIVEGTDDAAVWEAVSEAKQMLLDLRRCALRDVRWRKGTTPEKLLQIAQMHARGETHDKIAVALGMKRDTVTHHLRPSVAMIRACALAELPTPTPSKRRKAA